METSRTEPRHSLFWLVTGYVIAITLLVLLGALLYYFTGSSFDLPELLPGQIAFRAAMVWLVLIWFCAPFILCWKALVKLKAREATGATGNKKQRPPENQLVKDITTQLQFQYGRHWRSKVRIMLIVGEENEVEQAIPGLTTQHWLEGHGALLLWHGSPLAEPDAAELKAFRKIRRRLADALVWVVNAQTELSHDSLDTVARQLQKQYHLLGWEIPLWLWETHALEWEQPGLPAQGTGFLTAPGDEADDFRHSLNQLETELVRQGMQQTLNDRKHGFLLQLAHSLRDGGTERLTHTLSQLAEGARALPLAGMVFSPAITSGTASLRHAWQPGKAWLDLLAQRWRKPVATGVSWRRSLLLACTCLLAFLLAATAFSWVANLRLMQADRQLAQSAIDTRQPMPKRLMALYQLQHEIERLQHRQQYGAPWYMRMGLSRNDDVLDALWPYWQQAAMPLLRDASAQHLSSLMNTWRNLPPDDPQRAAQSKVMYDQLRAYLMLSRPDKADPAFFGSTVMQFWPQREGVQDGTWRAVGNSMLTFMMQNLPAHLEWRITPDMRLVSGMRTGLLRQIGASNAESTRYQKMIEQVSRDYADMTLSAMVNGTDSSQLFSTDVTVPGVFTRKAWEEDVQPAIEKLAKSRREEIDWVLSDAQHSSDTADTVSPETLKARLTARYFSDYSGAWLKFLNSLQWHQAGSLSESIDQLTLLADVRQSPLIALVNTLNVQGRAGQTGGDLTDSLVSSAKNLIHSDKANTAIQQAGNEAHGPLDATFGPLLSLTGGDASQNSLSLQTFLTRITRVRLRLQQVTNAPDPQAMMQSLALTVFQGKAVDLTDTRDYGSLIAASLGQEWSGFGQTVFVQPMIQAWEQVLSPTSESLNSQWQSDIVTPWNASFADRYPFTERQSEASLPELAQFMRSDTGRIAQFIQTRLGGLLRLEGDKWVPDAMNSQGLTFSPAFLTALNRLTRVANVAFAHGDVALHFQLMAKPSRDVVESDLTLDRQKLQYFNQEESWQTLTWPDNRWQPQTTLTWRTVKTGARLYSDEPGSWGFIRLLDKALVTSLGDNLYRVAWITPDGVALNYQLRTELGKGPLSLLDLRGFMLPSQIFSTGGIAAAGTRTGGEQ
ncbi:ImcF-related family protein [Enterobacter sp. CC120223-11]|uniref:ImcF-related family protein n=1 Tax=Enterobacter sp. CC120223-11 TaxID=1378073 RepID=UPI000BD1FA2E|nr:ImcF-related family protein [Enterobacter sp. CC120223-11]SNY61320.1 type VI secretion system protein ImpL [Enterobacter sp. CC120223-11]